MIEKLFNTFNTRARMALVVIAALAFGAIAGAWGFEIIGGFEPCPLCLQQRWAYYVAVPIAGILIMMVLSGKISDGLLKAGLVVLSLVILAGGVLGGYHAGIEWGFWPGPTSCTSGGGMSGGLPDLSQKVVLCDKVQIRIFGLSFAGWNAVVSGFCAVVGLWGIAPGKAK